MKGHVREYVRKVKMHVGVSEDIQEGVCACEDVQKGIQQGVCEDEVYEKAYNKEFFYRNSSAKFSCCCLFGITLSSPSDQTSFLFFFFCIDRTYYERCVIRHANKVD